MTGRWLAVVALCAWLYGCNRPSTASGDPTRVKAVAEQMIANSPVPAAVPACSAQDLSGAVKMTFRTLQLIAGRTANRTSTETLDWANPTALDSAAAQSLLSPNGGVEHMRQAAGELLRAPSWIVYRVDLVNAPMALGIKELKTGTMTGRVIRYDRGSARPTCVTQWGVQNSPEKTDWAISVSTKSYIDPAVALVLREDLVAQYLSHVSSSAPTPKR